MFIIALVLVALWFTSLPFSSSPFYWLGFFPQVSHFHPGQVRLLSTSLLFSSLPYYKCSSCLQVSHFHPCLPIDWALVLKSSIFILALILVQVLSTSVPFSSLPYPNPNHYPFNGATPSKNLSYSYVIISCILFSLLKG